MSKEFNESVDVLFNKVEDLVSTKTVVGDAITIGDITIIPLIEVSVGAAAGTSSNLASSPQSKINKSTGGVGAKITPSAIMVIQNGSVQIMNINNPDAISKLIDMAPSVTSKINFSNIFSNRNKNEDNSDIDNEEDDNVGKNVDIDIDEKNVSEDF